MNHAFVQIFWPAAEAVKNGDAERFNLLVHLLTNETCNTLSIAVWQVTVQEIIVSRSSNAPHLLLNAFGSSPLGGSSAQVYDWADRLLKVPSQVSQKLVEPDRWFEKLIMVRCDLDGHVALRDISPARATT